MYSSDQTEIESSQITLNNLIVRVKELVGNPISVWAVAATLESLGIRNIDAKKDYGYDSIFKLADYVYNEIKKEIKENEGRQYSEENSEEQDKFVLGSAGRSLKLFAKQYTGGLVFSLPMFSQIIVVLVFEYALWAWFDFNNVQATVVGFGTIAAFIVTGGFTQALGRMVNKYLSEENYYLARKATKNLTAMATLTLLATGLVLFVVNLILPFFPVRMMFLSIIYFLLIGSLLLNSAILYALKQRIIIIVNFLIGTVLMILGMEVFGLGIYFSQWAGIGFTAFLMYAYSLLYYRFKIYSAANDQVNKVLPKPEVSYFVHYRYFIYGFSYFLFLFLDRILAWSTGNESLPYIFWYNAPYELGMIWALISFVLTVGILEYSINAFSGIILEAQKKASLRQSKSFNRFFKRFYLKQLVLLFIVGCLSIIITYYVILNLKVFQNDVPEIRDFFSNPITYQLFWLGSIGYLFLIYGLMNSLFFFTLNRPEFAMYTMVAAMIVNFFVGFVCSRVFDYHYAVFGLIAGALVFAVSTSIIARRFFKHLDYFYYSSY